MPGLRLHHPASQRDTPRRKQSHIKEAPQKPQSPPVEFPTNIATENGSKDGAQNKEYYLFCFFNLKSVLPRPGHKEKAMQPGKGLHSF